MQNNKGDFWPEIKKLCAIRIYANIKEAIVTIAKIEKVGKLGEIMYELMKEE